MDKVASKIIAFEEDGVAIYFGNYTDYLDEKKFLQEKSSQELSKPAVVKTRAVTKEKQRMSYLEKQEWAKIEEDIAAIEERIATIEVAMLECGSDFGRLADLQRT